MYAAPTVDYPVGRSRFHNFALGAVWFCVAGVDALWFSQTDTVDWRQWLGLVVTVFAAGIALHVWRISPQGRLSWDGRSWWWESNGFRVSGKVTPKLDLQAVLLLGFDAQSGARHWFWLERSAARPSWSALRRAVHARVQAETDASGTAPAMESRPRAGAGKR